jgi:integrase
MIVIVFQGIEIQVIQEIAALTVQQEAAIERKAEAIARDKTRYSSKARQNREHHPIRSVGTRQAVVSALKVFGRFLEASKLGNLGAVPSGAAQIFLLARAASGISRSQLKKDRMALEFAFGERLEPAAALPRAARPPREVSREQMDQIVKRQSPRNALSSEIAYDSGARAFELLTIARPEEQPPSDRNWIETMHLGSAQGVAYTVRGKGGLVHLIMLRKDLAEALERTRRPKPIKVRDRKRDLLSYYDIAGGVQWASSYRKAARRAFGESPGGHSTRHGYVANRRHTLKNLGLGKKAIDATISQEIGHFREDIIGQYYARGPWKPVGAAQLSL